jgi:hypothetical protein
MHDGVHGGFLQVLALAWVYVSALANFCQRLLTQHVFKIAKAHPDWQHWDFGACSCRQLLRENRTAGMGVSSY